MNQIYFAKINVGIVTDADDSLCTIFRVQEVFAAGKQRIRRSQKFKAGGKVRFRITRNRNCQESQNRLHGVAILKSNCATVKTNLIDDFGVSCDQVVVRVFFRVQISIVGVLVHLQQILKDHKQTFKYLSANFNFSKKTIYTTLAMIRQIILTS